MEIVLVAWEGSGAVFLTTDDALIKIIKKHADKITIWKGSADGLPFHLDGSGSAHRLPQMVIYGSAHRLPF